MRVRDKEHQSLGIKELQELCHDFPNDQELGEEVRKIAHATVNNPKGSRATGLNYEDIHQISRATTKTIPKH